MNKNTVTIDWVFDNLKVSVHSTGKGFMCLRTTVNLNKELIREALINGAIDYYEADEVKHKEDTYVGVKTVFEFPLDMLIQKYPKLYSKLLMQDYDTLVLLTYYKNDYKQSRFDYYFDEYNKRKEKELATAKFLTKNYKRII